MRWKIRWLDQQGNIWTETYEASSAEDAKLAFHWDHPDVAIEEIAEEAE